MTIAFVDQNVANPNASTWNISLPTSAAAGNLALIFYDINTSSVTNPTGPTGWTQLGTIQSAGTAATVAYWKFLTSGDITAGTVSLAWGSSTKAAISIVCYSGVDTTTPIDAWNVNVQTGLTTSHTTPTITIVTTGSEVIEHAWDKGSTGNTTWTAPSGYTARSTEAISSSANPSCVSGDSNSTFSAAASAGGNTWTSGASYIGGTYTVALRPSGGGGGGGGGGTIAFVDESVNNQNTSTATITVPPFAVGGNLALMFFDINTSSTTNPPVPSGWTQIATIENSGSSASLAYWKFLTTGDLGSTVSLNWGSTTKITSTMVCYSGVNTTTPIDGSNFAPQSTATTTHTTPTVSVVTTGALAVEHAYDKGATGNTSWTTPAADTLRAIEAIAGSANPSAATGEVTSTFTSGGTAGGNTWTSGQSYVGGTWTILLRPSSAPSGGAITFIDKAVSNANASSYSVTIPATANAGNIGIIFADIATTSAIAPTPPTGWTQLGSAVNSASTMISLCYYRMLTGGDPTSVVTLNWGSVTKGSLTLVIYSNVEPTLPIDSYGVLPNAIPSTTHVTPVVTTVNGSDKAIEHVADFTTAGNTTWTLPSGTTERALNAPGGTNNISCDTAGVDATLTASENIGGDTWTSGQSGISVTWTILLAPTGAAPLAVTEFFAKAGAWVSLPTFHL